MGRTSGKSLKVRQQTQTSDTENLVGRALKHHLTQETPAEVEVKRQNLSDEKEIQVDLESQITAKDLTCEHPSEKYWQKLAEKRQIALEESLEENAQLTKKIEFLKEELNKYKQMLDEANSFVEVIKEELYNSATDDTGIDVNDVSTADDTADDTAKDETDLDATKEADLDATKEADLDATKEKDLDATKEIE